ncbi:betaine-aldehyde dehydrogenase [Micromonospora pallida]|uniref:Betaine-aldehyde dehydrogenase n=1 Tax=Micromonospora pallida TaxID=145854 RepID=A0A1C6RSC7_9ACTN|nr:aldehyde dehydrogenase family protein [Micromonospora pallida]SCL20079.1 betaine-aldehyde dehydrogenase [Micromonospora pallida]
MTEAASRRTSINLVTEMTIDGAAMAGTGEEITVWNPATGGVLGTVVGASADQLETAIAAARRAFDSGPWPRMSGAERAAAMHRIADQMEKHRDDLVAAIVSEAGTPVTTAEALQFEVPLRILRWNADAAARDRREHLGPDFEILPSVSYVDYRPIGVVGAIAAYNYPLHLILLKIGAALAAGCTVVATPSPRTPFATLLLGKLIREAGLPPGVVNIVAGGLDVSRTLTTHPSIDKVSFTGSAEVGKRVMSQAAESLKDVVLELGGKSPNIILPGTDLTTLVAPVHMRYSRNAGQGCASPTRLLVHESQLDEFVERSSHMWPTMKVGDPWERDTLVGPLIRSEHRDRVASYVDDAVAEGATVLAGGGRLDIDGGWFYSPTLLGGVDSRARVAQEEIFGPVAVLLSYSDVDEAVRLANDVTYGLAAYIFGPLQEALEVAPRLQAGIVQINGGGSMRPDAPYGGFKASGIGREIGEAGIREYLEPQHVQFATAQPGRAV